MSFLLPVLLFLIPVLAVVLLATAFGRRLSGSCGGQDNGPCATCGRSAEEVAEARQGGSCS
ncbi:MAG: hypothetical protein AAF196_20225 [Planctomycetota bacterium]